jgi:hypothetical protein
MAEAYRLAGVDPDEVDCRLRAVPAPNSAGLLWLIVEYERAEREYSLVRKPSDDDALP